jgi:hypothetical protein
MPATVRRIVRFRVRCPQLTGACQQLAAFLIAVAGYLGSLARVAMPRLKSAAGAIEQPLWQTALD